MEKSQSHHYYEGIGNWNSSHFNKAKADFMSQSHHYIKGNFNIKIPGGTKIRFALTSQSHHYFEGNFNTAYSRTRIPILGNMGRNPTTTARALVTRQRSG